jgi:hypothetical protein
MQVIVVLLSLLVASATAAPEEPPEVPLPHHREGAWLRLGHSTPTVLAPQTFVVGKDAGWFSTLRVDRLWGVVQLEQVKIVRGQSSETFNVNIRLDQHKTSTYLNLGRPRTIDEVIVTTDTKQRGAFSIYGASSNPRPEVARH